MKNAGDWPFGNHEHVYQGVSDSEYRDRPVHPTIL